MKTLLIPFLVFPFLVFAQLDSIKGKNNAFSFEETCYRLWWVDNKMGGYDGYEFRSNGELKLLNYDLSIGKKWWVKGDHLFTETVSMNKGKILTHDYLIKKQTDDSLVLNYFVLGDNHTFNYEAIIHGNFTDQLLGHWEGEGESYIQIIPMSSFRFQLVLSKNKAESVERVEGFLDKENSRIIFYLEMEGKELTIYFEAGKEAISIAGKTYFRKC
ncbi:hypothetical protein [Fluviicola sp.]|uniref:hypothetical protein n=1 Tax=Fluviicola sp. TaxID=1917219 RepID=UPI003D2687BA